MSQQTTIPQHFQYLSGQVPQNLRDAVVEAWRWLRHLCQLSVPVEDNVDVDVDDERVVLTIYPANRRGGRSLVVTVSSHSAQLVGTSGYLGFAGQVAPVVVQALSYALNDLERWRLYQEVLQEVQKERVDWEEDWADDRKLITVIDEAVRRFQERHGIQNTGAYKWMTLVEWANAGILRWCFVPVTTGLSPDCSA